MQLQRTLSLLPAELFEEILRRAVDAHPVPHAISRVNSAWADISLPLLHSRISLNSPQQLHLFSSAQGVLRCAPGGREVEVFLPGGTEGAGVWAMIYQALARCQHSTGSSLKSCCRGVRILRLCLNSHLGDPNMHLVHDALSQINPEVFVWKGPDPDHHFSTAIVSTAAGQLCKATHNWSSLRSLKLSNISFLYDGRELAQALLEICRCPPFPFNPHYSNNIGPVHVVISQAVFMLPISVLQIALGVPTLKEFHLIDVYQNSIWGPRLRLGDVEAVISTGEYVSDASEQDCLRQVREVVSCVARTERLIGGDRELQHR